MPRALTLRLDGPDYERLETEARNLGMRPGQLARVLLHASLTAKARDADSSRAARRLTAIEQLAALATGPTPADAVRLVAEAREDFGREA